MEERSLDRGLAYRHLICKRQDTAGSMSKISWPCANQRRTPWLHQFKRLFQAIFKRGTVCDEHYGTRGDPSLLSLLPPSLADGIAALSLSEQRLQS